MKKKIVLGLVILSIVLVVILVIKFMITSIMDGIIVGDVEQMEVTAEEDDYVVDIMKHVVQMDSQGIGEQAHARYQQEEYKAAYNIFKHLIKVNEDMYGDNYKIDSPTSYSIQYMMMAKCYIGINGFEKAVYWSEKALEEFPETYTTNDITEEEFNYRKKEVIHTNAIAVYQDCISKGFDEAEAVVSLLENTIEGTIDNHEVIRLDMLAHLYNYSESVYSEDKTINCYERLIESDFEDIATRAKYNKLAALYEFGRYTEALEYHDEIRSLFDEGRQSDILSIFELIARNEYKEATKGIDDLSGVLSSSKSQISQLKLYIALLECNNKEAIKLINTMIELAPGEVFTVQFKEYEQMFDLDFSGKRLEIQKEIIGYNQIELDVEYE